MDISTGFEEEGSRGLGVDTSPLDRLLAAGFARPNAGLKNPCYSCYINVVIQLLYSDGPFRNWLNHAVPLFYVGTSVVTALRRLFIQMDTSTKPVDTASFRQAYGITEAMIHSQQEDAQEFLVRLHDVITEEVGELQTQSFNDLVLGSIIKTIQYSDSKNTRRQKSDSFSTYTLTPLSTLTEALAEVIADEETDGTCEMGDKGSERAKGVATTKFERLNASIILQLRLFTFTVVKTPENAAQVLVRKHLDFVSFPSTLDMTPYMINSSSTSGWKGRCTFAIVHSESTELHRGHYYAYMLLSEGVWWLFNDGLSDLVSEQQVFQDKPYILVYDQINDGVQTAHRLLQKNEQKQMQETFILVDLWTVESLQAGVTTLASKQDILDDVSFRSLEVNGTVRLVAFRQFVAEVLLRGSSVGDIITLSNRVEFWRVEEVGLTRTRRITTAVTVGPNDMIGDVVRGTVVGLYVHILAADAGTMYGCRLVVPESIASPPHFLLCGRTSPLISADAHCFLLLLACITHTQSLRCPTPCSCLWCRTLQGTKTPHLPPQYFSGT